MNDSTLLPAGKKRKSRRRGDGEGSAFQRGDGRWCAVLDLGWAQGRRKRKCFYGKTAQEVQDKLLRARTDLKDGLPIAGDRETMGSFLARWLVESVKPSVRQSTHDTYEQHVRRYLLPAFGKTKLSKLSPADVESFRNRQLARGLSPRTVQLSLVTLKRALKQAEAWGLVARNVGKLVDGPHVRSHEVRPLTPEQSRHLLETAQGHQLEALFTVLLLCGLRVGEALGLCWDDVDFEGRRLTVQRSLARVGRREEGGSKLILQQPKTARARRILHLPDRVSDALRTHRAKQAGLRLAAGTAWDNHGQVFCNGIGRPLEASAVHRAFKKLLRSGGLPQSTRIHDLRHSSASLLLSLGVPLKTIQEILGHSSIRVTSDVYAHLAPQMLRDAADQMDSIFSQ